MLQAPDSNMKLKRHLKIETHCGTYILKHMQYMYFEEEYTIAMKQVILIILY